MNKLKIAFWGYDKSAELKLRELCSISDVQVKCLIVPSNRNEEIVSRITSIAKENGITVFQPECLKENTLFYDSLRLVAPDVFIVDSYTRLIPQQFLNLPKLGAFNFHPGKLPEYRGAHVLNWAIIKGEEKITVSVHRMDKSFDTGDIVCAEEIIVSILDDINSIFNKVCEQGVDLVIKLIEGIKAGTLEGYRQGEFGAKHYPARTPEDGKIDWSRTNMEIYNLIRALTSPWPYAFFVYKDNRVRVKEAYPLEVSTADPPGTVLAVNERSFCVATGHNVLLVRDADTIKFEGGELLQ